MVSAETDRLAALAAQSAAGGGPQMGVLETAIRAAFTRLGAGLLEDLLALDPGYRGPQVPCGTGHLARFVSYRDKVTDTVLGPVTVRRAYHHCAQCGHGAVPRDRELGTEHASLSPGLRSMTAHAATAVPFAKATALLEELAGISLTVKRAERSAEVAVRPRDGEVAGQVVWRYWYGLAWHALFPRGLTGAGLAAPTWKSSGERVSTPCSLMPPGSEGSVPSILGGASLGFA